MKCGTKRIRFDWAEVLSAVVCACASLAMLARCFFGTELTDEVYAISDALAAMDGNLPFAYNTSILAGQALVPMLFYKVYAWFVPGLEGIVLYSRLSFVVFKLVILWVIYCLLKPDFSRKHRLLIVGTMIPFMGSQMQNFSYNTVAAFLTLLTSVLLYCANRDSGWKQYGKLLISGFLTAIAVFAHPARAVAVFAFLLLIWLNSDAGSRIRNAMLYCAGGVIGIFVVMVPIGIAAGFDRLLYGLETFLFCTQRLSEENTYSLAARMTSVIAEGKKNWAGLLIGTIGGTYAFGWLSKKMGKPADRKNLWFLSLGLVLILEFLYASYFFKQGLIIAAAFVMCVCFFRRKNAPDWYIALPAVAHTLFLLLTTNASYLDRFLYMIPLVMVLLGIMFQSESKAVMRVGAVLAIVFIMKSCVWDYTFVYRDNPVPELKTKVSEGVYKGLYTTESRAKDLPELEKYLNGNISLEESVSFRDNVPVAYMLRNKNIWDIRTWDEMQWNHNCNDPTSMYRYYQNRGGIPDVIAYVKFDYGKETWSIDHSEEEFQFNAFVNRYYELESDEQVNETFRVRIYRRNELPDPDFDRLIESVK